MKETLIDCRDVIWRMHVNATDNTLYLECKNLEKEFYLWNAETKKEWHFPTLEHHTCTILHIQYPYALLQYVNTDNLMNPVLLMCYSLEQNKELWSTSVYKLEECFLNELKVYKAKISPKKYEYINFNNEIITTAKEIPLSIDVQHADKNEQMHQLKYKGTEFTLQYDENAAILLLKYLENDVLAWQKEIPHAEFKFEYDYLLRLADCYMVLLDKHRILILNK